VALFGKQLKGAFTSSAGAIGGTSMANLDYQDSSLVKRDTMGSFSGGSGSGSSGSGSGSSGASGSTTPSGVNLTSPNGGDSGSSHSTAISGGDTVVSGANTTGTHGVATSSGKNPGGSDGSMGGNSSGGPATAGAQSLSGNSPSKSDDIIIPIRETRKPGLMEYIQANFLFVVLILLAVGLGLYCATTYLTLKKKR
jgi:hypothetical protein